MTRPLRSWIFGLLLCSLTAPGTAQTAKPAEPAPGTLLVASARVAPGRFHEAVVLLVTVSDKGAAGLVLNQPGAVPLPRLFPHLASAEGRTDVAFTGGPVDPKTTFCLLHLQGKLREAREILPGVFFSTSQDLMALALNSQQPPTAFRVFQGYAGWTPGQLPREVAAGLWTVVPATAAILFDSDPATLWTRLAAARR